jgi:sulfide:quinone oxidoreductase
MNINQLHKKLSISDQITTEDVAVLAKKGVTLLINNRPDNEEINQPSSAEIAQAAEKLAIAYIYLPMKNREVSEQTLNNFMQLNIDNYHSHLFCRTGTRSKILWQHSQEMND